jgi:hypothetical protein
MRELEVAVLTLELEFCFDDAGGVEGEGEGAALLLEDKAWKLY